MTDAPITANSALATLLATLLPLLVAALTWVGKEAAQWVADRRKHDNADSARFQLDAAARAGVRLVEQTMPDKDSAAKKAAAVLATKGFLGPAGLALQKSALGITDAELDVVIGDRVEAAVHDLTEGVSVAGAADVAAVASAKALEDVATLPTDPPAQQKATP